MEVGEGVSQQGPPLCIAALLKISPGGYLGLTIPIGTPWEGVQNPV